MRLLNRPFLRVHKHGWEEGFEPHLAYANHDFSGNIPDMGFIQLIRWLECVGPVGWREQKTIKYLRHHQNEFRSCIDWLCRDADEQMSELRDDCQDLDDDDYDFNVREYLVGVPAVQFLQQHTFDHMRIELGHYGPDRSTFSGLTLEHGAPKDPLDPICWYLISLLAEDRHIHILRCEYHLCSRYFQPAPKQIYCEPRCRIKDHTKSTEEMRLYMRKHRALQKERAGKA